MGGLIFINTSSIDEGKHLEGENKVAKSLAVETAKILHDAKGFDVLVLNVGNVTLIADYFVIASGSSPRHVRALADNLVYSETLKKPVHVEGYQVGYWILLDYGDVVVHIFREDERHFYGLERLWGDVPHLDLENGKSGELCSINIVEESEK